MANKGSTQWYKDMAQKLNVVTSELHTGRMSLKWGIDATSEDEIQKLIDKHKASLDLNFKELVISGKCSSKFEGFLQPLDKYIGGIDPIGDDRDISMGLVIDGCYHNVSKEQQKDKNLFGEMIASSEAMITRRSMTRESFYKEYPHKFEEMLPKTAGAAKGFGGIYPRIEKALDPESKMLPPWFYDAALDGLSGVRSDNPLKLFYSDPPRGAGFDLETKMIDEKAKRFCDNYNTPEYKKIETQADLDEAEKKLKLMAERQEASTDQEKARNAMRQMCVLPPKETRWKNQLFYIRSLDALVYCHDHENKRLILGSISLFRRDAIFSIARQKIGDSEFFLIHDPIPVDEKFLHMYPFMVKRELGQLGPNKKVWATKRSFDNYGYVDIKLNGAEWLMDAPRIDSSGFTE